MAWNSYQIFLAIVMVLAGSINIITLKWTDMTFSVGREGFRKKFNHPFIQGLSMFFGELIWLFVYKFCILYYKSKNIPEDLYPTAIRGGTFNPIIFCLPALLDMIGTTIMFIGLNMTTASSFQMLRAGLIIFTGLLSAGCLGQRLKIHEFIGIILIIAGLATVGAGDVVDFENTSLDTKTIVTGDLLILISQVIIAAQYVYEQRFVQNVSPFQAIGWEGFFGFVTLLIILVPAYYIHVGKYLSGIFNNPDGRLEDAIDAFYQIRNCWEIMVGFLGATLSIAFFNMSGISVTKELSALSRTVLDSLRTLIVWIFSLCIGWHPFSPLHLIGFVILVFGMFVYEDVIFRKLLIKAGFVRDYEEADVFYSENGQSRDSMTDASRYGSVTDFSTSSVSPNDNNTSLKSVVR
ncbi:transmembrane protein C2orf18-like protein [Leptotrombidium deliense]|uniref:Transmembrane protein C2orf18-like protein n=1 Tax=Leptotrombidium deliense TaxID=299467 RepID=A0A443S9V2_9ACAR|nr:transmembrane protein C2orf18-like protein [Leptotrombidium deliense]